jgi:hypothetical protein
MQILLPDSLIFKNSVDLSLRMESEGDLKDFYVLTFDCKTFHGVSFYSNDLDD